MSLTIATSHIPAPAPKIVAPETLRQKAGEGGVAAELLDRIVSYTFPIIRTDTTGLHFEQRVTASGREFRFERGTLRLTLRHEIYLLDELTPCEQRIWGDYERDHVADNERLLPDLEQEICADPWLKEVLIDRHWYSRDSFGDVDGRIPPAVGGIFWRLTNEAVRRRATVGEYARVRQRIRLECRGPFRYTVVRGDTLSGIAQLYYGDARLWERIYRANEEVIGPDPHLIQPKQTLTIPARE